MHTVFRRGNKWQVRFVRADGGYMPAIMVFDKGQDAFAFSNYMNGGRGGRSPDLTEDGWGAFLRECEHYSEEEMKAND